MAGRVISVLTGALVLALGCILGAGPGLARTRSGGALRDSVIPTGRSAPRAYLGAVLRLCGEKPATKDSLRVMMNELGFAPNGLEWTFVDQDGETTVSGTAGSSDPEAFMIVSFVPSARREVSAGVIASLTAKADKVELAGPDEIGFEFDGVAPVLSASAVPLCRRTETVYVALLDGAWTRTSSFVTWK